MAQDGSQPWTGAGAFPYLMHHPAAESAVKSKSAATEEKAAPTDGNTGTWNGPAPTGAAARAEKAAVNAASSASPPAKQQDYVLLPGASHLPLIGLGTYKVDSKETIRTALDAGYKHFDCASSYNNEAIIGEAFQDWLDAGHPREELFITSKVWNDHHRAADVRDSAEKTIADLKCKYLDLLLVHWPDPWLLGTEEKPDTEVTMKETWQALEELHSEGKVKHLGVSNFSLAQVQQLSQLARVKPVANQIELHPLLAQRKLVGGCFRQGVACVAYSPLGHGTSGFTDIPEVVKIAKEIGRDPGQVFLKWNVQRGVVVIPRSRTEKNIKGNIDGLFDWELKPEHKEVLDTLDCGKRTVEQDWHDWEAATIKWP